jgi:hypothetical protein
MDAPRAVQRNCAGQGGSTLRRFAPASADVEAQRALAPADVLTTALQPRTVTDMVEVCTPSGANLHLIDAGKRLCWRSPRALLS